MARIDSHQHFWKYDPALHEWINNDMAVIQKDFMPADLQHVLVQHGFEGSVLVQVDQNETENDLMLVLASGNEFIKGIVGWVDLQSHMLEERLMHYHDVEKLKGFRHILQGEKDRALMLKPAFTKGISLLSKYNFTYDILIYPDQLRYAYELVKMFPAQLFVIDHIAKPYIKNKDINDWKTGMSVFADCENVYCKISGMVTEANWNNWMYNDFVPYLDVIVDTFGTKRIMYGSDWPVCLVASTYTSMLSIVEQYFSSFSKQEQADFFGNNAQNFYHL